MLARTNVSGLSHGWGVETNESANFFRDCAWDSLFSKVEILLEWSCDSEFQQGWRRANAPVLDALECGHPGACNQLPP